jgi:hypothetical protein
VNFVLGQSIRSIQADVNQRQQFINQGIRLNRINEGLIRMIAQTAINDGDDNLRDVLTRNGITVSRPSTTPSGSTASPPSASTPAPGAGATTPAPRTVTPPSPPSPAPTPAPNTPK